MQSTINRLPQMQFDYLREAFTLHDIPMDEKLNIEALTEPPPTPFLIRVNHSNNCRWLSHTTASYSEVTTAFNEITANHDYPFNKKCIYTVLLREKCGYTDTNLSEATGLSKEYVKKILNQHDSKIFQLPYKTLYYQCLEKIEQLQQNQAA